ncbi:heparinase II/III domain-containing protein [Runella sp.]|uniref:heparinase II/III domain-containing protein n=1 Tax=Runella sp. TaxID=1960881 RepID=UPI003D0EA291
MKKIFFLFISCFLFKVAYGQQKKAHPYLFYTNERIKQTKERIQTDTAMARAWNTMLQRADKSLNEKSGNLETLTLAYCMTSDKKYAEKAKTLLLDWVNRPQWDGMDDRTPRWNSGLGTARGCFQSAIAFDGIYDILSPTERKSIADKIVKLGIEPSINDWVSEDKRIHSLNSMGHNWWAAVVFEAGIAALAVMNEEPKAKGRAEEIMRASKEWFTFAGSVLENKPSNFDRDGGFYESVNYANFGVSEYLYFRLAWTNAFGKVSMPYDNTLEKTVDWFINTSYPTSKGRMFSLNFGDSNDHANGERPAKLLLALGLGKEHYRWYLNEIGNSEGREDMNLNTPLGLLYHPTEVGSKNKNNESKIVNPTSKTSNPLPLSAIYKDMGWGMLRSSWAKDATLLGVKSGFTWNHAHADAGSFVLYHKGKYLLIDGGDVSYGQPEYSSYFVRSEAHNIMLFNGKAQDPQDQYYAVKNVGQLHHLIDSGNLKYIMADATAPTSRYFLRNYRHFLWVNNVILVLDDLKTYEAGKFEFLLHYQNEAKKKGPDLEITNGDASVLFRPLFPETLPLGYPHDFPDKMKLEERQGIKDRDAKTKIPYYALSPAEPSRQTKFLNAILLLDENNKPTETFVGSSGANGAVSRTNLPFIEKLEGTNMIGVKLTQNGKVTMVYLNLLADGRLMHRNANNTIDGWETDAYLTAITFPEHADLTNPDNATSIFVSNGSYLRKDGKTFLHSLSKVFMNVSYNKDKMEVQLDGQPVMHVSLRSVQKPQSVSVNGKVVTAEHLGQKMVLDIEK